ncbi:MAG: 50S ribosomal protein L25 [Acidobacteriota bacterium]
MADVVIEVEEREARGKNNSRRLRRAGMIPAVVYGAAKPVVPVSVDPAVLQAVIGSQSGENTLLKLRLKGKDAERHAMIKDYQVDPVSGCVVHADFIRIDMEQKITVSVPIQIHGTAPGVKDQGGLLEVVQRNLEVECLPGDIPEQLLVDVSELNIGDNVRVENLAAGKRFLILQDADTVIVTLVAPRAVEEEAPEEEAAVEGAAAETDATTGEAPEATGPSDGKTGS